MLKEWKRSLGGGFDGEKGAKRAPDKGNDLVVPIRSVREWMSCYQTQREDEILSWAEGEHRDHLPLKRAGLRQK